MITLRLHGKHDYNYYIHQPTAAHTAELKQITRSCRSLNDITDGLLRFYENYSISKSCKNFAFVSTKKDLDWLKVFNDVTVIALLRFVLCLLQKFHNKTGKLQPYVFYAVSSQYLIEDGVRRKQKYYIQNKKFSHVLTTRVEEKFQIRIKVQNK